jgi:hypothetical protein
VAAHPASYTGQFLVKHLNGHRELVKA